MLSLGLWSVLVACRPTDRAFPGDQVSLFVSTTEIAIGPAPLDGSATTELLVWNDGGDGASLTHEIFGADFEVLGGPWALVADGQVTLTVLFEPSLPNDSTG